MAEQYAPIAKDESFNTTDLTPKNIADVLKDGLQNIADSVKPTADEIPFDNTGTSLVSDNVQDAIDELDALTSDIPNISVNKTLAGDVLTHAQTMPNNSVEFYINSNNPSNQPTGGSWGSYLFFKNSNLTTIIYADSRMLASTYSVSSDSTSITWHIT